MVGGGESVTIVGGGVAGLTLAGALNPGRFDVRLIEQRPELPAVGTGFGIWPFAMDALSRLGLAEQVRDRAVPVGQGKISFAQREVTMTPSGLHLIPRCDLLQVLDDAVPESVQRETRRVDDVSAEPGDLLVAADGVGSVVRRTIWGDSPRRIDCVAVRGVLPEPCELSGMGEYWADGMLFGVTTNARSTTNWYAAGSGVPGDPASALDWARQAFAGFPAPVRHVLDVATPELTLVNPIRESRMTTHLVRGRYVLIGDAAHAMSPNLGRGACESIVDACELADAMNTLGARAGARRYQRRRLVKPQLIKLGAVAVRRLSLAGPGVHRALARVVR